MSDVINAHDLGIAGGYIIEAAMQRDIDQLKAENAKLRELFNETLIRLVAANEAAGGGFTDARYCELLESHGIEVDG